MGNMGNKGFGQPGQPKKNEEKKQIKKPETSTMKLGKKKKKTKGVDIAAKLPTVVPNSKCLLRMRKYERIKDYLLMEEEFVKSQSKYKTEDEKAEEEKNLIEIIRGDPIKYIYLTLASVLSKKL
jgi:26S proteasome regulatory subunit T2